MCDRDSVTACTIEIARRVCDTHDDVQDILRQVCIQRVDHSTTHRGLRYLTVFSPEGRLYQVGAC